MSFKLSKLEKIMGGAIVSLILFIWIREGCNTDEKNSLISDLVNYKDSAKYYNMKVDGMQVEVAYNKSLILENNNQVKSVLSSMNDTLAKLVKKFKDIKSGTIINNYTTINGDTIKHGKDSIPCNFKPFKVRRDSVHYKFIGTIAKNYFSIDTLNIPNKISLIIGTKKLGLFKREERAEIVNSNPLVHTTNIGNYEVIKRKKRIGIGPSVGYGFTFSYGLKGSPYIGISANYNIIEF